MAAPDPVAIAGELRACWWPAVAGVARATRDLAAAEDAVQEACLAALAQWPLTGLPAEPRAWLVATARHKALDAIRREARRAGKEAAAEQLRQVSGAPVDRAAEVPPEDQLALIFLCCHPAFDPEVRVALTLRAVCGLTTAQIAAAFLVPEPTVAKRLVRARRKIRDTGMAFALPAAEGMADRLAAVLRVVYLVFTEGHRATTGVGLVRADLCDAAVRLARTLARLLPGEPEVGGLLALLLLTDARRAARTDQDGDLLLLAEQDRSRYDRARIAEGEAALQRALALRRPGPYQVQAAIAACHSTAPSAAATDWGEIAALYGELLRWEPSPVHEANRAVAVAMVDGPAAGLAILARVLAHPRMGRWPAVHIARADLLHRLGRDADAVTAYRTALETGPAPAERRFVERRLRELSALATGPLLR